MNISFDENDAEVQETILKLFEKLDADGSGTLEIEEFQEAFKEFVKDCEVDNAAKMFFEVADADGNGHLDKEEFIRTMNIINSMKDDSMETIYTAFYRLADSDNSNALDRDEFKRICKAIGFEGDIDEALEEMDENGDGVIQLEEFLGALLDDE